MLSTTGGKLKVSPKKILEKYNKIKKQNKSKNVVIGFGITEKTIKSLKKADEQKEKIKQQESKVLGQKLVKRTESKEKSTQLYNS